MPTLENEQVDGASTEAVNLLKRNSDDVGWEYGVLVYANNKDKVRCNLCNKEMRGGIYRLKQHLAHEGKNVTKCPARTQQGLYEGEEFSSEEEEYESDEDEDE